MEELRLLLGFAMVTSGKKILSCAHAHNRPLSSHANCRSMQRTEGLNDMRAFSVGFNIPI